MARKLPALPASSTDLGTSMLGFATALAAIGVMRFFFRDIDPLMAAIIVLAAAIAPPVVADLLYFRRYREKTAGLGKSRKGDARLLIRKCFGLAITLAGFGLLYAIIPEYHGSLYQTYWQLLGLGLPVVAIATPFYFHWCLKHEDNPHDGYDELALLFMGQVKGRDWAEIGRHWRNWLVKAFFLPLMLTYVADSIHVMLLWDSPLADFHIFYRLGDHVIMFADLLYASTGYLLTFRILNAQIRSSDPTLKGWFFAVICYQPFWQSLLYGRYFAYDRGIGWNAWLSDHPWLTIGWGTAILVLLGIYSLSTICLGIRFSNLTYRGLITSGPYRFCKHPAYVAKNLSWWLVSVPFIQYGDDWRHAAVCCLLLLGVNFIYFMRARTEEQHLSNYPEYVAYALAMNERSIFRPLARVLPFLKYTKPKYIPSV